MRFILGKKLEMSQLFSESGDVMPVTLVQAGPCLVTQVKSSDGKDGYAAVQIGFGKKKNLSKALHGHLKGLGDFRWIREFRCDKCSLKHGDKITANVFAEGDKVKIVGNSKGKGFQGVVKRHGFHGQHASHGTKDQERAPGSIGATEPARVFKGMKMPGHMGNEKVTVKNLEIVKIDKDKNILYLKGAVPGSRGSLVQIMADEEMKKHTDKHADESLISADKKKDKEIKKLSKEEIKGKEKKKEEIKEKKAEKKKDN